MDSIDITKLKKNAAQVAGEHAALTEAKRAELAAEVSLLNSVIEAVRPSLMALSSKVQAGERTWWPDNVSTDTKKTMSKHRGLRVVGTGPDEDHSRANEGSVEGIDLFLLDDGTFLRAYYSGNWSRWQGATSEWTTEFTRVTVTKVCELEDVSEIIGTITAALESHLGKRKDATKAATERARKLRALADLV